MLPRCCQSVSTTGGRERQRESRGRRKQRKADRKPGGGVTVNTMCIYRL
uniref:Uncharacterized protein n=1 Tax=Anguilla anguilla TaxID=7936 RepID=A0A0E9T930_ANGAN